MNSTDQAVRDIGIIWDNDEATHRFIVETVRFSSSWMEVSSKVRDVLREVNRLCVERVFLQGDRRQLIDQQGAYIHRCFDELARGYRRDMKEQSA